MLEEARHVQGVLPVNSMNTSSSEGAFIWRSSRSFRVDSRSRASPNTVCPTVAVRSSTPPSDGSAAATPGSPRKRAISTGSAVRTAICDSARYRAMSSAGFPSATTRPPSMIAMRSHRTLRLLDVMGGQEDSAPLLPHLKDRLVQVAAGLRVEPGGRLIEEDDLRLVHEREGQREPLPLPGRERVERGVPLLREREPLEEFPGVRAPGVERAEQFHRLPRRDLILQSRGLQHHADPLLDLAGLGEGVQPAQTDRASVRLPKPDRAFDDGGLSRPVPAEQAKYLPLRNLEAHPAHGLDRAVAFHEIAQNQFGHDEINCRVPAQRPLLRLASRPTAAPVPCHRAAAGA